MAARCRRPAPAPVAIQSRGHPVCTYVNVTDRAIQSELDHCGGTPDERLATLQRTLNCGTRCSSCLPELKRMAQALVIPLSPPSPAGGRSKATA